MQSSSQSGVHFPSTRKTTRACKDCVAAKAKCTGGIPCQRCEKRSIPCLPRDSAERSRNFNLEEDSAHGETHEEPGLFADQSASASAASNPDEPIRSPQPLNSSGRATSLDAGISATGGRQPCLPTEPPANFNQEDFFDLDSCFGAEFGEFVLENLITDSGWERLISTGRIRRASKAFKDSLWYSVSDKTSNDNTGAARDLRSVTVQEESEAFARGLHSSVPQRFTQSTRDSLLVSLALLAQTQSTDCLKILRSGFPTPKLLNVLVHLFLSRQNRKVDSWIHSASFQPNETNVELTTMIISTSALNTNFTTLRQLGTDLRQLLRPVIIKELEGDPEPSRKLTLYQALLLNLELDLWQDEADCLDRAGRFASVIATFLRQELRSQSHESTFFPLVLGDRAETAEQWLEWVAVESHKRLITRFRIYDNQLAMTLGTRALTAPSEYRILSPHPKDLWLARNPTEWKRIYLAQRPAYVPRVMDILLSIPAVRDFQGAFMDEGLAIKLIFHTICGSITEFQLSRRDLRGFYSGQASGITIPESSEIRRKELETAVDNFEDAFNKSNKNIGARYIGTFLVAYLTMSLRVSVADIEVLVGKAGEHESREMYQYMKDWPDSVDAREAIWHAGQILQLVKLIDRLTSFQIIQSYHACLVLFAFSVLSTVHGRHPEERNKSKFCLNELASPSQAHAFIHDTSIEPILKTDHRGTERATVSLLATKEAMEAASEIILNRACSCEELSPRLVNGLVRLLKELASAIQIFRLESNLPEF